VAGVLCGLGSLGSIGLTVRSSGPPTATVFRVRSRRRPLSSGVSTILGDPVSLLHEIDFDKLVVPLLRDLAGAVSGWLSGVPQSEAALVNRLTEVLASRRRCRGVTYNDSWIDVETYLLDRRGPRGTDLFGSDLAVTVEVVSPSNHLAKTAFIQAKMGDFEQVLIEKRQIKDSLINSFTAARSFVLAADRARSGALKLESVSAIDSQFPATQESAQLPTCDWRPVTPWLYDWLSCSEGERSDPADPRSPEKMLARAVQLVEWPPVDIETVLREFDLPSGSLPRAWVRYVVHVPRSRD